MRLCTFDKRSGLFAQRGIPVLGSINLETFLAEIGKDVEPGVSTLYWTASTLRRSPHRTILNRLLVLVCPLMTFPLSAPWPTKYRHYCRLTLLPYASIRA